MRLVSHPDHPPGAVTGIDVEAERSGNILRLRFAVAGKVDRLRIATGVGRTDELWRHSCFEAFVRGSTDRYTEFNFAPTGAWAAYAFDRYREGMQDASASPTIGWDGQTLTAEVAVGVRGSWRLNLTSIIEEGDGTKSYWALAHPDGAPDFHDPGCFVLSLPAAG